MQFYAIVCRATRQMHDRDEDISLHLHESHSVVRETKAEYRNYHQVSFSTLQLSISILQPI